MRLYKLLTALHMLSPLSAKPLHSKKICRECKHFVTYGNECKKFGDVDLITGIENYESARIVRGDITKCGENGTLFEKNDLLFIRNARDFALTYWPMTIPMALTAYYSFNLYKYMFILKHF